MGDSSSAGRCMSGAALGVRERAEFAASVVSDRVHPNDLAALAQLYRSGDDRHVDALPSPRSPAAVSCTSEADHPAVVSQPGHGQAGRGVSRSPLNLRSWCPVRLIWLKPLRMSRDQHPGMQHLDQPSVTTTSTGSPANVGPTA